MKTFQFMWQMIRYQLDARCDWPWPVCDHRNRHIAYHQRQDNAAGVLSPGGRGGNCAGRK